MKSFGVDKDAQLNEYTLELLKLIHSMISTNSIHYIKKSKGYKEGSDNDLRTQIVVFRWLSKFSWVVFSHSFMCLSDDLRIEAPSTEQRKRQQSTLYPN